MALDKWQYTNFESNSPFSHHEKSERVNLGGVALQTSKWCLLTPSQMPLSRYFLHSLPFSISHHPVKTSYFPCPLPPSFPVVVAIGKLAARKFRHLQTQGMLGFVVYEGILMEEQKGVS